MVQSKRSYLTGSYIHSPVSEDVGCENRNIRLKRYYVESLGLSYGYVLERVDGPSSKRPLSRDLRRSGCIRKLRHHGQNLEDLDRGVSADTSGSFQPDLRDSFRRRKDRDGQP